MTYQEIIQLLEKNKDERGIKHWERAGYGKGKVSSLGIGLTKLRKMAKQIGRDHIVALELWESDILEAKLLSTFVEEPKKITREQAEKQVEETNFWMLSHAYCSCNGTLAKVPFVRELAMDWIESDDHLRRRSGYLLMYELAKDKKDKALTDDFFEKYLDLIKNNIKSEENFVKDAMNSALMRIGMRNKNLWGKSLKIAKDIGPVMVDYGANSCQAINVVKHLTADRVVKKFQ
ncbi:MAG: DNA alkylation repair protein [Bacteroidetes bacterium]|nr:DNA alkylation repair protein [Bacteroidota bacterium]